MASKLTSWTGLSWSFGFTNSVTPKFLAVKEIKNQNHRQHVNRNIYLCIPLMTHPYRNEQGSDQHQWFLKPQLSLRLHKPKYQYKIRDLEFFLILLQLPETIEHSNKENSQQGQQHPIQRRLQFDPFGVLQHSKWHPCLQAQKQIDQWKIIKKIVGILSLI